LKEYRNCGNAIEGRITMKVTDKGIAIAQFEVCDVCRRVSEIGYAERLTTVDIRRPEAVRSEVKRLCPGCAEKLWALLDGREEYDHGNG
jgi:hypothetical protein